MKRAILVFGLLLAVSTAQAQTVSVGLLGALGDYREVSSSLRFRGGGGGLTLQIRVKQLSAEASATRLNYDPRDANSGQESFKATQLDARIGYEIAGGVSAELGVLRRNIDPELAAQEMGAARIGVRYSKLIGPGATVALRGNYLAGAKFTGEGSAGLAFELGLLVSAGPQNGRYRFMADFGFQRIDRKVGTTKVPIQQSLVRLGAAAGF